MSATTTNTTAANLLNETAPRAVIRIAIPSFLPGWGKSKKRATKPASSIREEFQSAFNDLNRTVDAKVVLTREERRDYDQALDLRAALYSKSH